MVVAIGFGIFMYARSSLNSGSDKLNTALDTVNAADFADYDQKSVSGTKVLSALQNFEGTPVAVLIRTKALAKGSGKIVAEKSGGVSSAKNRYFVDAGILQNAGTATETVANCKAYVNYNAILGNSTAMATASVGGDGSGAGGASNVKIGLDDGTYIASFGFYSIGGVVQYYGTKTDYQTTGMTEYIASGTKFQANLIKDASGTVLGVVFDQIS